MHFLRNDKYGPSNQYNNVLQTNCCFRYNGSTINVDKMQPIIIRKKACLLPRVENLIMNLNTNFNGYLESNGGFAGLTRGPYGEPDVTEVGIEEDSLVLTQYSGKNFFFLDGFDSSRTNYYSLSYTCKLKDFKSNHPYRTIPFSELAAENMYNYCFLTFSNSAELTLYYQSQNSHSGTRQEFKFSLKTDEFFNITETYNNVDKTYTLYHNGVKKFSFVFSAYNGNSLGRIKSGISMMANYDFTNVNYAGLPQFYTDRELQYKLLTRGVKLYDCLLNENDIKQIMRYDGII